METKVFKNTIEKSIHQTQELYNINVNNWINITNISNNINKVQSTSQSSENERTNNNKKLYYKSLKYWSVLFSSSIVVLIIEKIIPYIYKSKNHTSDKLPEISFEMTHLELHNRDEESIISEQSSIHSVAKKIIDKPYARKIMKTIINNIFLCGFILAFEYLFFNYIILKYKIISTPEIHYLFVKSLNN